MCNEPLRELSNPGASGSIFYLSADDEFIIKTVQHKEGEFLMKLLLGYYMVWVTEVNICTYCHNRMFVSIITIEPQPESANIATQIFRLVLLYM